jgi:ribosomal protein S27AE
METTTNESRGLGIRVYYHVGIAPTEAGYVISDVRFVEYNGYVYHGYSSEHPNVVLGNATRTFPWFLVAVIVIVALYLPLFVIAVKREKPLCPYCGNEVSEEYNYCPNCGFWLKYSEPPEITNRIGEKY